MSQKKRTTRKTSGRVKRPTLPRTEPIRSWSTLFGPIAAPSPQAENPEPNSAGTAGFPSDSVRRGVEVGYRVMDEYMRQGAAVASAFTAPPRSGGLSSEDLPKLTERMMRYMSDFTSLWFDAMSIMTGSANGQARPAAADPAAQAAGSHRGAPGAGRSRYVLEVKSERPTEVIVAIDEPYEADLVVDPLKSRSGDESISGASIQSPAEPGAPLRVRVHVPGGLPAGRYSGAILDVATRQPKGRLTVTLAE